VPSAELQLKDLGTNNVRKAETQTNGVYSFPNLPFGLYELNVSKTGFQTQVFESVQVQTGRTTSVKVPLKVGGMMQAVTVAATETPLLEPDSSPFSRTGRSPLALTPNRSSPAQTPAAPWF
jgi:hypothetical protein